MKQEEHLETQESVVITKPGYFNRIMYGVNNVLFYLVAFISANISLLISLLLPSFWIVEVVKVFGAVGLLFAVRHFRASYIFFIVMIALVIFILGVLSGSYTSIFLFLVINTILLTIIKKIANQPSLLFWIPVYVLFYGFLIVSFIGLLVLDFGISHCGSIALDWTGSGFELVQKSGDMSHELCRELSKPK